MGDNDPTANKSAERQVVVLFALSVLDTIGFVIAYFAVPPGDSPARCGVSNLVLGLGLFLATFAIGVAAVHWAKALMNDHEKSEERHAIRAADETRAAAVDRPQGGRAGLRHRPPRRAPGRDDLGPRDRPARHLVPQIGNMGGDWNVSQVPPHDVGEGHSSSPATRPARPSRPLTSPSAPSST